jgi:HK97 family phage portal protein
MSKLEKSARSLLAGQVSWEDEWVKSASRASLPSKRAPVQVSYPPFLNNVSRYSYRSLQRGLEDLLADYRSDPWFQKLLNIRAQNFAAIPWQLFEKPGKDPTKAATRRVKSMKHAQVIGVARHKAFTKAVDTGDLREVEENPVLNLFHTPNPVMSGTALRQIWCRWYDACGDTYIFKRRNSYGTVIELWPLSPTWVLRTPSSDRPTFEVSAFGWTAYVKQEDMIWIKNPDMSNPYVQGTGSGQALGDYIDTNKFAMELQSAYYRNGALPTAFIGLPEGTTDDTAADFKQRLEDGHRGASRSFRPMVAQGDIKVQQLDVTQGMNASAPILKAVRDVLVSVTGVPPELAGILSSSNRSTIDAAETIFARHALVPLAELFMDEMIRQLVAPDFDDRLLLAFESPVPEDKETRLKVMQAFPWAFTKQEIRDEAGLPRRGGASDDDVHLVPANLRAVKDLNDLPEPVQPGSMPSGAFGAAPPWGGEQGQLAKAITALTSWLKAGGPEGFKKGGRRDAAAPRTKAPKDELPDPLMDPLLSAILHPKQIDKVAAAADADVIIEDLEPIWHHQMQAWGQDALDETGIETTFDMRDPAIEKHLREFGGDRIQNMVNETTRQQLRDAMAEGVANGEGIEDIAARVNAVFDEADATRAELIARTEVLRSSNFAALEGYIQSGVVPQKEWLATPDEYVREEHAALGESGPIPVEDDFTYGEFSGPAPGQLRDGSGKDSAAMNCNCRCTVIPVVDPVKAINGGSKLDRISRWKAFDAKATTWEQKAAAGLRSGFAKQRKSVLTALDELAK